MWVVEQIGDVEVESFDGAVLGQSCENGHVTAFEIDVYELKFFERGSFVGD